ncbi:MAG TPA: hypothetical protein VFT72_02040 [Opitutaceae bacterium]|nr:hypothetical protein [Opitutaceae bacterium]
MHPHFRLLALFSATVLLAGSAFADTSLKDELSPREFESAGLNRLTPAELANLNRLVRVDREHGSSAARDSERASPQKQNTFSVEGGAAGFGREEKVVRQLDRETPKEIRSRILGEFKGWTGHSTFRLENGQVWRQTDGSSFTARLKDPVVIIRKASLGSYRLKIEGFSTQTTVQRVD